MSLTIDTFQISSDFKSINVTVTTSCTFDTCSIFLGDDYLVPTPIDFSDEIDGLTGEQSFVITNVGLGLEATDTIKGIVFAHCTNTISEEDESALFNSYYLDLTLAKMIITQSVAKGFEDINTIYLLLKAINIYLTTQRYEDALNAYDRVIAMVQNDSNYLVTEDLDESVAGSGEWIINGNYIIT